MRFLCQVRPETRNQLRKVISVSRQHETRVRAAGAQHAFSDLYPDNEGVLVDMASYELDSQDRMYITYAVSLI